MAKKRSSLNASKKQIKKQKNNYIYKNFLISLKDLKKIKSYFWFSFFLFFAVFIIGLFFPVFFVDEILKLIKELVAQTRGLGFLGLIRFIISNNIQSAFFGLILGVFLGIFPLAVIVINSYILGFVANKIIAVEGVLILWRLLPHGIFEIPAVLISVALGLKLGIELMKNCIFHYKKTSKSELYFLIIISMILFPISIFIYLITTISKQKLRKKILMNLKNSLRIFILIVIPLLVIAGIIEGLLISLLS